SYPAIFLSGFKLVSVVKGSTGSPGKRPIFRNALVVGQFVASIVLLVGTATIYYQLKFMQERDPGFKKDNLLYLKFSGELYNKQKAMEDALAKNPLTNNFSFVSELPINLPTGAIQYDWQGKDPNMRTVIPSMGIDEHFISTFKMKMVSGRAFSTSSRADSNNYIINEKLARIMGRTPESAVGKSFSYGSIKGMIVGVVADFNFKPVQQAIEPLALMLNRWIGYVVIRTKPETTAQTINALSKICSELNPSYPFQYDFIDQDIANEYRGEQQMSSIFNLFSALAVFISCLGLYGLSAFIAEQRRKEIGVRKVLGASVTKIVYLLSGNIIRLIILAIVIALPIAWYGAHEWLQGFAFHIEIGWSLFVFASVGALAIAWLTVSFESLRAATTNPVKSLRSE
ncbi:MAG TPA: FtsX-like permease family protein, partial [Puia sp.]|nr:FtsX-like permease family protein [Puia sp.]